jgi:hypothetical protein
MSSPEQLDPDGEYAYMWGEQGQFCTPCFDADDPPAVVTASSSLKGYPAANVMDDTWIRDINGAWKLLERAWCEGKEDAGVGEWVEFSYPVDMRFAFLEISPAYAKSKETLSRNNQVKKLTLWMDDEKVATLDFTAMQQAHSYHSAFYATDDREKNPDLEDKVENTKFKKLRFVIDEVHPGQKDNDTCISLIVPWVYRDRD